MMMTIAAVAPNTALATVTRRTLVGLAIVGAMSATPLRAQSVDQVATVPPNVVLSNYDNVPVGPFGGLEGSAYVARVGDPSAGSIRLACPARLACRLAAAPASTNGLPSRRGPCRTAADRDASCRASSASPLTCAVDSPRAPRS